MRKLLFLFLLIFATTTIQAQDYLISFAGSGASATVDTVSVENLTQGTSLGVGAGNQLQLLGTLTGTKPAVTKANSNLQIYPNPAKENVFVSFATTACAHASVSVTALPGSQVATANAFFAGGRHTIRISGLKSGIYIVQITSDAYWFTGKIISQSISVKPPEIDLFGQSPGPPATENLKNTGTVVQMQYNTGDLLKFTGRSGIHGTVYMDVPTSGKTITFNFIPCTDYDNSSYTIVQVNDQWWMAENLKATKYSNGDDIPVVPGSSAWMGLTTGACCYFGNDPGNALVYGCLYNWYAAADNRNVCPANWHVPSDAEWIELTTFLGGEPIAGGKMKEPGTDHWFSPNAGATNETGLTLVAGGLRSYGNFDAMGYGASLWSTTAFDDIFAWNRDIFYYNSVANHSGTDKKSGLSVRCVKDM